MVDVDEDLSKLPIIDPQQLAQHTSTSSCWIVVDGLVMDVTDFHHPVRAGLWEWLP